MSEYTYLKRIIIILKVSSTGQTIQKLALLIVAAVNWTQLEQIYDKVRISSSSLSFKFELGLWVQVRVKVCSFWVLFQFFLSSVTFSGLKFIKGALQMRA